MTDSYSSNQPPVLSVLNLGVDFPTDSGVFHAVDHVSFDIAAGEVLGMIGESGAGKSMTGSAITRLIDPPGRIVSGEIRLQGERIDTLSDKALASLRGRRIGTVFQDPLVSLNPLYTIGQQLVETIRRHLPLDAVAARKRAVELLTEVDIHDAEQRLGAYPHQFSGGMRQRVVIALAIAADPELLIADEPTSALDVTVQLEVLGILDKLVAERGMGLIFISHDLRLVSSFCDRVIVMYAGKIVEEIAASDLANAKHPYTQGLLNCMPKIGADQHPLPTLQRQEAWRL